MVSSVQANLLALICAPWDRGGRRVRPFWSRQRGHSRAGQGQRVNDAHFYFSHSSYLRRLQQQVHRQAIRVERARVRLCFMVCGR